MDWTANPPSIEGWYWWRAWSEEDHEAGEAEVVHIHPLDEHSPLFVENFGWLDEMPDGEWYGPLKEPK